MEARKLRVAVASRVEEVPEPILVVVETSQAPKHETRLPAMMFKPF